MTAEGYDYEYALTTIIHDQWGYGSYSSTTGTFTIEVTVDPPAWTCGSCRRDKRLWTQQAAVGQAAAQLVGKEPGQGAHIDRRSLRRSSIRGGRGVSFFQVVRRSRDGTPTEAGLLREAPQGRAAKV